MSGWLKAIQWKILLLWFKSIAMDQVAGLWFVTKQKQTNKQESKFLENVYSMIFFVFCLFLVSQYETKAFYVVCVGMNKEKM